MMKLDHVGIAVPDTKSAKNNFCNIFGVDPESESIGEWEANGNKTVLLPIGDESLEIMAPLTKGVGDISKFLEEKGEGLFHLAFLVENFDKTMAELEKKGVPVDILDPLEGDKEYKHAMIKAGEYTNQVMIYFFNQEYQP